MIKSAIMTTGESTTITAIRTSVAELLLSSNAITNLTIKVLRYAYLRTSQHPPEPTTTAKSRTRPAAPPPRSATARATRSLSLPWTQAWYTTPRWRTTPTSSAP
jgi:hypothetical protein